MFIYTCVLSVSLSNYYSKNSGNRSALPSLTVDSASLLLLVNQPDFSIANIFNKLSKASSIPTIDE